ncbi:septation protein IspZ [Idiomarina piscisalsi]|uniref:Inner membrane-spanning protein YciB n=1 Tax=Idiomarina piscisalsi TaxID=1096243 RepID=A0ABN5AND2_9GAMM|nr:septation protein IspZ [Idiomarina piscisalsi]ASG65398.1 septation protein IspZ [Idiomarina piscisalsi]
MALLLEYIPIIAFFVFYKMADIYVATGVLMAGTVVQLLGLKLLRQPLTTRHWVLLAVVMVFGAVTLLLRDDWFIKMKVSVVYVAIALLLLGGLFWKKRSPIQSMMGKDIQLPDAAWLKLTYAWIVFCLALAALNLYIAEFWSQEAWVNFKVFGILGITLVFTIGTGLYMYRHASEEENTQ